MRSKLFSTAFLQQRASADKTWLQALQAHKDEETRASQQAANGANSGSPFIRNDPERWPRAAAWNLVAANSNALAKDSGPG